MIKFLTLFPQAENVHLIKDVGMIPFILHKYYGYDSSLACYKNGSYNYLTSEVEGLKISFIKKYISNQTFDSIIFLIRNCHIYDVLQVYHLTSFSLIMAIVFKTFKLGKGKVYLKLDAGDDISELKFKGFRKVVFMLANRFLDIVSAENQKIVSEIKKNISFRAIPQYIPNGFYPEFEDYIYDKKENIILTVGRIGSFQKNNEFLLDAFNLFAKNNTDWKLFLVGPVAAEFKEYLDRFLNENFELKERIILAGSIQNREELRDYYAKAKIFVLTSRYEGFPLVFLEAMNSGCTIVSTKLNAALDVTDSNKYGKVVEENDVEKFSEVLIRLSENEENMNSNFSKVRKYAKSNFYWPTICMKIDELIKTTK